MGVLTLIIAALIISNPDSIAYLIAAFLLLYGVSNLIKLFQKTPDQNKRKPRDPNEIIID
jgi:uncharacterized membrane protein HdeD (DUF308 family)